MAYLSMDFSSGQVGVPLSKAGNYCFSFGLKNQMELPFSIVQVSKQTGNKQLALLPCSHNSNGDQFLYPFIVLPQYYRDEIFEGQK